MEQVDTDILNELPYPYTGYIPKSMRAKLRKHKCLRCASEAYYVDSWYQYFCDQCWYKALDKTVRSTKRKPPVEGPKHWISETHYHLIE